jgi:phage terminase large subunit-like protein
VDFAYTVTKKADFTAIAVVGVDSLNNIYILEIDRFRTDRISDYFQHILKLYQKWDFRKLRVEVISAGTILIKDLKENYIRQYGLQLTLDENKPNRHEGRKEERINAALQSRYANGQIWHYKGGNCEILEEELVLQRPPHDDCKDALAAVMDILVAPSPVFGSLGSMKKKVDVNKMIHSQFGGLGG